jgi:hypothetical protein
MLLAKAHGINNPDVTLSLVLDLLLSFITAETQPCRLNRVVLTPSAEA